jgi:Kdo2-lipid IVA lauroyltransferase/acyltransferase
MLARLYSVSTPHLPAIIPMKLKHRLEYLLLRSTILVINLLPVPVILALCSTLGYLAWVVFPFRLKVAYHNLSIVFPERSHREKLRLLRRVYLQFTRTFGLVFILHRKKLSDLVRNTRITGRDKIDRALANGKGVILTTLHASWFEAYFAWFNMSGLPTSLIYQKQSNPLSDAFFVRQRGRYGQSLEHLSSYDGMKTYQQALERNRLLIVSLDQSYTSRGVSVPFFNRPLACARGSAILHLRTGAPVFTSVYYMKDGELHIDFDEVALPNYQEGDDMAVADICSRCLSLYEPFIRTYPEQWFSLFHRLWSKKGYQPVPRTIPQIFF